MIWLMFPASLAFVLLVFGATSWALRRLSDRRWARLMRDQNRRELRRNTWAEMARLGGW